MINLEALQAFHRVAFVEENVVAHKQQAVWTCAPQYNQVTESLVWCLEFSERMEVLLNCCGRGGALPTNSGVRSLSYH